MRFATAVGMSSAIAKDASGNTAPVLHAVRPTSFWSSRHVAVALFANRSLLDQRQLAYVAHEVAQPLVRPAVRDRLFSLTLFARLLKCSIASSGSTGRDSKRGFLNQWIDAPPDCRSRPRRVVYVGHTLDAARSQARCPTK